MTVYNVYTIYWMCVHLYSTYLLLYIIQYKVLHTDKIYIYIYILYHSTVHLLIYTYLLICIKVVQPVTLPYDSDSPPTQHHHNVHK